LVLFAIAVRAAHPAAIRAELGRLRLAAGLLLIPYALGTTFGALPWGVLLPNQIRPRPVALVASRFVASSANALLPLFGLAGEPARLLWLEPAARPEGVAAIVLDRALYNCSNGILLSLGAVAAYLGTRLPVSWSLAALSAGIITLATTLALLFAVVRFGIGSRVHSLLVRALGSAYTDADAGGRVDMALLALLRGGFPRLTRCLLLHVAGRALILLEVFVALRLLGAHATAADAAALAVVPIALSLVFSSVPSQLGVQEGGQALVAAALGFGAALGVTLVLLQRFRQLVFAAGMPLLLRVARPQRPSPSGASLSRRRSGLGLVLCGEKPHAHHEDEAEPDEQRH
jgi:hypothetical protein